MTASHMVGMAGTPPDLQPNPMTAGWVANLHIFRSDPWLRFTHEDVQRYLRSLDRVPGKHGGPAGIDAWKVGGAQDGTSVSL